MPRNPHSRPGRLLLRALATLLACAFLSAAPGCAVQQAPRATQVLDRIVWPPPPMEPRVAWVQSIATSRDAGLRKGVWGRIADALLGEEVVRIARPYGIHVDAKKRIFIADTGARAVHVIDRAKGRYHLVSGPSQGGFASPIGVTQDAGEMVYVTDSAAAAVYRFNLVDLQAEPFITRGLSRPTGVAYSPVTDLIYVSDTVAGQVVAFTRAGKESFRFGVPGEKTGQFNRPTDLAVDGEGRILVTDALNGRVQVFSASGFFQSGFGESGNASGTFAKPKGVAVDSHGHMHVCDALFDTVQVFNRQGELLLSYGNRGSGKGELWMPSGLYIDRDDTIYVADTYNNRIQIFQFLRDVTEK